jgi:hypothetical protein
MGGRGQTHPQRGRRGEGIDMDTRNPVRSRDGRSRHRRVLEGLEITMHRGLVAAGFTALAVIGGYVGFQIADQEPPVIASNMRIEPNPAPAGDRHVRRKIDFYRTRSCETHVSQMIFAGPGGSQRFVLPDLNFPGQSLPLGQDSASVPILIPASAPPGPAIHRAINVYRCNWLHRWFPIRAAPRDIHFTIAGPADKPAP